MDRSPRCARTGCRPALIRPRRRASSASWEEAGALLGATHLWFSIDKTDFPYLSSIRAVSSREDAFRACNLQRQSWRRFFQTRDLLTVDARHYVVHRGRLDCGGTRELLRS